VFLSSRSVQHVPGLLPLSGDGRGKKQEGGTYKNPSLKAPVIALPGGNVKITEQDLGMVDEYAQEEVWMLFKLVCHAERNAKLSAYQSIGVPSIA